VKDITEGNFGVIIAFWLPGFILLWTLSYSSNDLALWLKQASCPAAPTIGDFLYGTIASLAAGLIINAVRWVFVDHILFVCSHLNKRLAGLRRPKLDFSRVREKDVLEGFNAAVNNYFRYYQYYSNTLVALTVGYGTYSAYKKNLWLPEITLWYLLISSALLLASGDCLQKFYVSISQILKPQL
jgi:hypothetical protein